MKRPTLETARLFVGGTLQPSTIPNAGRFHDQFGRLALGNATTPAGWVVVVNAGHGFHPDEDCGLMELIIVIDYIVACGGVGIACTHQVLAQSGSCPNRLYFIDLKSAINCDQ